MSLALIDGKLFTFYRLEIFVNNFSSIGARNMKTPPFNARHHCNSNELYFVILQSLDGEILWINVLELGPFRYFWQVGVCICIVLHIKVYIYTFLNAICLHSHHFLALKNRALFNTMQRPKNFMKFIDLL